MKSYKRIQVVGKGSFGCCWLVHSESGERCILKQIDVSKMPEKQKMEAANEVKVLSRLRHPFIINYRESFVDAGLLCIIMDFAERGDLYRAITAQKQAKSLFSERLVVRWFAQIALALKHIHDRHILHRDLKTQNIFLAGSGEGMVKVGDFGIARVLRHTQDCARTAIGTPFYLSPEICQERPYSYKSDVWSMGCVLYELATLRHAFDAESMRGLVLKILRGVPPQVPCVFSPELRSLISEMLTKDPQCRPSVNELLQRPLVRTTIRQLLTELEAQRCTSPKLRRDATPPKKKAPEAPQVSRRPQMKHLQHRERPRSASRESRESSRAASQSPRQVKSNVVWSQNLPKPRHMEPRKAVDKSHIEDKEQSKDSKDSKDCKELIRTLEEGLNSKLHEDREGKQDLEPQDECPPCFLHPDGDEIKLRVGKTDSLAYRIEALRLYLEKELGISEFLLAYKHLESGQMVDSMLSNKGIRFLPLVTQLVVCEDSFYGNRKAA